ncbi:MAG: SOS response-associated peptidase [Anaerolineales bacterium]
MCGRFTLTANPAAFQQTFGGFEFPAQFAPRYNIAPSQPILAIPNDGKMRADFFAWGLIPSWAKAPDAMKPFINARGETLGEKPAFRGSFKYKRCLIFADGFYEWQAQSNGKSKTPYFIYLKDRQPFAFAGLWAEWQSELRTCAIVTTAPNELMANIHSRMPVILEPQHYAEWLDPAPREPEILQRLLSPFPAERMAAHVVSTLVNSPANDRAECSQSL